MGSPVHFSSLFPGYESFESYVYCADSFQEYVLSVQFLNDVFFFFKMYLFFGCGESLLLHSGAICYGAQPLGTEASVVPAVGLVALLHVGSS